MRVKMIMIQMYLRLMWIYFFFFFQAEDGIRDIGVTGVQTCALPIYRLPAGDDAERFDRLALVGEPAQAPLVIGDERLDRGGAVGAAAHGKGDSEVRSEERRVGKECRSRWSPYH